MTYFSEEKKRTLKEAAIDDLLISYGKSMEVNAMLYKALDAFLAQHERPHGFDDNHWYKQVASEARTALGIAEETLRK